MEMFDLKGLHDWQPLPLDARVEFTMDDTRFIVFDLNSSGACSVTAEIYEAEGAEPVLMPVAYSSGGMVSVRFACAFAVVLRFDFKRGQCAAIKTFLGSQVLPESAEPSFANLAPRVLGEHEQFARMMRRANENNARLFAQLQAQINASQPVVDPQPIVVEPSGGGDVPAV